MTRRILSTISRLGSEVDVLEHGTTGSNAFNNPQSTWTKTGTTRCVRTYPNRNTEVNQDGPFERDRALFMFAQGEQPPSNSRIRYDGVLYELKSPTEYDTHVAIFGNRVNNK